jgi:hypothetical protein
MIIAEAINACLSMKGKLGLDILELAIFSLFFPNVKI